MVIGLHAELRDKGTGSLCTSHMHVPEVLITLSMEGKEGQECKAIDR